MVTNNLSNVVKPRINQPHAITNFMGALYVYHPQMVGLLLGSSHYLSILHHYGDIPVNYTHHGLKATIIIKHDIKK